MYTSRECSPSDGLSPSFGGDRDHCLAEATGKIHRWVYNVYSSEYILLLMILPQVHLRKPCYDFYFL
jgi:hypothetical protein